MRVTIGLPVYNGAATLAEALKSIFAQTYSDWELVAVDDGSTDGSLEILHRVTDPRVRVHADGYTRFLAARLNEITALATGDLVARMDADDLMHPERIARQVAVFRENPAIDVIGSAAYVMDEHAIPRGKRGYLVDMRPARILRAGLFVHPTVMFRTRWARANPYDPEYIRSQDHELWCRVSRDLRAALLPEALLFYREPGRFHLAPYIRSCRDRIRALRNHGPEIIGPAGTWRLVQRMHLTALSYRTVHALRCERYLLRRRNTKLDSGEARHAARIIDRIRATAVPGLADENLGAA